MITGIHFNSADNISTHQLFCRKNRYLCWIHWKYRTPIKLQSSDFFRAPYCSLTHILWTYSVPYAITIEFKPVSVRFILFESSKTSQHFVIYITLWSGTYLVRSVRKYKKNGPCFFVYNVYTCGSHAVYQQRNPPFALRLTQNDRRIWLHVFNS